ncbi:MAG: Crp/Fnr family transcriptional regulator [Gammaproteobacteria bacterium]|nr:Crp/Fnr family transcriptional regulator [Gammaproteobacteria bacterium]
MNFHELLQIEGVMIEKEKGEHVFMQGDSDKSLYVIQSGLLKAYYTSENGKESIKSFFLSSDIIGSLASSYLGGACSFSLLCLEPTILTKIPFKKLRDYCKKDVNMANEMIELLLRFAMKKEKREYEFLCLSAEERFYILENNSPSLLEKVTQNDLARYLGVTPVGLSRIKKRTLRACK